MDPVYPIYVRSVDDGDIQRYKDVFEMQSHLEKIDVENHEFQAWDYNGQPLQLSVQHPVWINVQPNPALDQCSLTSAIAKFAEQSGGNTAINPSAPEGSHELFNKILERSAQLRKERPFLDWLLRRCRKKS